MNDKATIIVTGAEPLHAACMAAMADAEKQGVTAIFLPDPPPLVLIKAMPPMPEINFALLKQPHAERAMPNQPWYAKFQKKRRRKF